MLHLHCALIGMVFVLATLLDHGLVILIRKSNLESIKTIRPFVSIANIMDYIGMFFQVSFKTYNIATNLGNVFLISQ